VDHSTVSRRLAALEESLGARLFERTPEGLVATDAARAIAPPAEQIDYLTRELRDAVRAASDAPAGPVRVAVSPVIAEHFLMPRVPQLLRRYPGIELDVRENITCASIVGQREADIAIRQHPRGKAPAEPSAIAVKVGELGFAVFASQEYIERIRRFKDPGDTVVVGTTVLRVVAIDRLWARAAVDESMLANLREGMPAEVALLGDTGVPLRGTVDRIGREVDRQTHEVLVDVLLGVVPTRLAIGHRSACSTPSTRWRTVG
jgi:DNA-binding transcriptional LysR family regulator